MDNRVAFISGATSGIGAAFAQHKALFYLHNILHKEVMILLLPAARVMKYLFL